jgi:hypothetical protein
MEGSGSDTLVVEDHFVPDHRVQRVEPMLEGNFATPFQVAEQSSNMAFSATGSLILVAAQLGLARHAMERTLEKLPSKIVAYTMQKTHRCTSSALPRPSPSSIWQNC